MSANGVLRGIRHARQRELTVAVIRAGWEVHQTNSGHVKYTSPSGAVIHAPLTTSHNGRIARLAKELREAGAPV